MIFNANSKMVQNELKDWVYEDRKGNVLFNDSFRLTARFFYMHHPTDRIAHTTAFVTPVVEHWLEREIGSLSVSLITFVLKRVAQNRIQRTKMRWTLSKQGAVR